MPQNVSLAYRGATYAIGQGPQFYGIWPVSAPQAQPLEWWPLTPEGWAAAWARFASIEAPGTIASLLPGAAPGGQPVQAGPGVAGTAAAGPGVAGPAAAATAGDEPPAASDQPTDQAASPAWIGPAVAGAGPAAAAAASSGPPAAGTVAFAAPGGAAGQTGPVPGTPTQSDRIAAGLLGLGVVLGIVGLFPSYLFGTSLASQAYDVVPHVIYFAAWALSGALLLLGGRRARVGALLGLGTSAVTFGLFFADAGYAMSSGAHLIGAGLVLGILGWLGCAAGSVVAARREVTPGSGPAAWRTLAGRPGSQGSNELVQVVAMIAAAVGAAIAFAPSWDRFTLGLASGATQTVTAGNAFSNPIPVIIGDVLTMVVLVVVVAVAGIAALRRPGRLAVAFAVGAAVPLVAQAISALVQITEPAPPQEFGVTPSQATALGLKIHSGLTPVFWVYCAFVVVLILLAIQLLAARPPAWVPGSPTRYAAGPYGAGPYGAGPVSGGPSGAGQYWPGSGPSPYQPAGSPAGQQGTVPPAASA